MKRPFKFTSRRGFLKQAGAAALASSALARSTFAFSQAAVATVRDKAVENRAPLASNAFYTLPLGTVLPVGWLRDQLQIQADGLGGHLDETWADVGPNSGWLGGTGESWERGPYFLDGLVPLAYLLNDARLKAKAQKYIDWTLSSQTANGMMGPASNDDWWPRMVMLKVLTQYQEATGDPRVIPFMERYYAYQYAQLPKRPLRDWGKFRWQDEALCVLWLYNRNGDPKLLDLVRLLHQQGFDWPANFADFKYTSMVTAEFIKLNQGGGLADLALATHGVNNGQAIKAQPVWSLVSNSEKDRQGITQQLAMLDKYHGLPNGMFSCDEHLAGRNPSQGSELCTVVEMMYSLEQSLAILGDPALGDRLERVAYNALPGTFTDDMWAHQYNQEPNQVEVSLHRKPWTTDGPESNLFGLEPNFGCCTANFHQGWPKLAASLFMLSNDNGLVAAVYAPCEVKTLVRGVNVHVIEETDYPFRETIRLTINVASPLAFPLRLRIPSWTAGAAITINGQVQAAPSAGSFARIDRIWKQGDRVEIRLPMTPQISRWYNDSIAVERGPLVYSLGIGEGWLKLRDRGMTADWQVYPTSQWNYALNIDPKNVAMSVRVTETPIAAGPFTRHGAPVKLEVTGRKIPGWLAEDGVANPVPVSPLKSEEPEEKLTLIPYGAAKLRVTAFPILRD